MQKLIWIHEIVETGHLESTLCMYFSCSIVQLGNIFKDRRKLLDSNGAWNSQTHTHCTIEGDNKMFHLMENWENIHQVIINWDLHCKYKYVGSYKG